MELWIPKYTIYTLDYYVPVIHEKTKQQVLQTKGIEASY